MEEINGVVFGVWFLIGAALVFWMQAGFAMVETGFTRAKNAGNIIMKNLMDFCIGTVTFILIGFSLLLGEDVIGLIGGFNSWGETAAMSPSQDFLTWTGEFALSEGDEFKFRANDNWNINLGGDVNNLLPDGSNLKAAETGTYVVTLYLASHPYTCTIVKK